jgi:hypothetical protein
MLQLSSDFVLFHVPDLDLKQASVFVLLKVDVDWEMGIDVSHLVFVALGDADDKVVDQCSDCAESSNIFPCAVVEFDVDEAWGGMREGNCQMAQVLGELACRRELVQLW